MMVKILLVVAMIVIGQAEQDLKMFMKKTEKMFDELQSKVQDISEENTELTSTVIDLQVENSELKIALNEDLQELKAENSELKKDIQKVKVKNEELECQATELVKDVSFLKSPPVYHICVYQSYTTATSSNVDFEKTLYSQCNNCQNANFDLASGVYTNGWPGTYTVTWDLTALDDAGENWVDIYLKKNGEIIDESLHVSRYTGSSGWVDDQGGRTLILRMETGEELSLWCEDCSASVNLITFCVSLTTAD